MESSGNSFRHSRPTKSSSPFPCQLIIPERGLSHARVSPPFSGRLNFHFVTATILCFRNYCLFFLWESRVDIATAQQTEGEKIDCTVGAAVEQEKQSEMNL